MDALPVKMPHGPGFQLISGHSLVDADEKTASANFPYTGTEKLDLADHFPGMPIFPGALLLEAMAQTAIQVAQVSYEMQGKNFFFAGIEKARFHYQIPAPAVINMKAKVVSLKMSIGRAECQAEVDGKIVGEATIIFAVAPKT